MPAAEAPDGFGSRWQTVCGLRLHALESCAGRGAPAVLLPGLVTASRSMVPLARALAASGMRVWIVDPPGFGYSDKPRRSLSVAGQAAVVARWLAAAGCTPARVLGNSFGTQVAAAVAADHPGAVGRLVLLSPTAAPETRAVGVLAGSAARCGVAPRGDGGPGQGLPATVGAVAGPAARPAAHCPRRRPAAARLEHRRLLLREALFGVEQSLDRLAGYLSGAAPYDCIRLTVFPHGEDSIGLPPAGDWQAVLGSAREHGELVAVDPGRYPRHFRALSGFHRELARLPRVPPPPPLGWDAAQRYLSARAPAYNVTFGTYR